MIKKLKPLKEAVRVVKSNAVLFTKIRKFNQKIGLDLIVVSSFRNNIYKTIFSGSAAGSIIKKRYTVLRGPYRKSI